MIEVRTIKSADLFWPFESERPHFKTAPKRADYCREVSVDPFPCYAHDPDLVAKCARQAAAEFPIGFPVTIYLPEYEVPSRTNAFACQEHIYGGKPPYEFDGTIVLSGKRIPLHPAMTRHLVAHEYGHQVHAWIEYKYGERDNGGLTKFERDYMEIRGGDKLYGAGRWHSNVGELIADDFRICVAGVEFEFWPHPGFEHPTTLASVNEVWRWIKAEYAHVEAQAA